MGDGSFQEQKADITTRLGILQEAEDNYYISAKYLLELANRAYELFKSSEAEERRQLIKLVLSNLRVEDKLVRYDAIKPFDTILNYADSQLWLKNHNSNITTSLSHIIKTHMLILPNIWYIRNKLWKLILLPKIIKDKF